jgi:hypothetical protein
MVNGRLLKILFDWDSPEATTIPERFNQKKTKTIATRMHDVIEKDKEFIAKILKKSRR